MGIKEIDLKSKKKHNPSNGNMNKFLQSLLMHPYGALRLAEDTVAALLLLGADSPSAR